MKKILPAYVSPITAKKTPPAIPMMATLKRYMNSDFDILSLRYFKNPYPWSSAKTPEK